jgi:putative PEP-CTERM system histidine kinase
MTFNFASISFGAAAAAFLLLTLLLATSWRGQKQGLRVICACLVTSLWALLLTLHANGLVQSDWLVFLSERIRDGAWLLVLSGIVAPVLARGWIYATFAVWAALSSAGLGYAWMGYPQWGDWTAPLVLSRAGLAISVIALLLLEQIYRNADDFGRQAARPLILGVGGLFAYDLILYSQAEILGAISADTWKVRGLTNALMVPLIALAARAQPLWSLDIFVSRQFVLYTGSLAAIGGYLVMLALGAYYVRLLGGSWSGVAELLLLVLGAGLLITLMMSERLRRRAAVFLSKHFYRNKYDYRLEWLRFIETLAGTDSGDVRRVGIQAIAQIFASPGAILFMRDKDETSYAPVVSWPEELLKQVPLNDVSAGAELVRILRQRQWIVDLEEVRADPASREQMALPQGLIEANALRIITPLLHGDSLVGFVVLCAPPAPFELTYEDRDLLHTVGRHVATHLAQHEAERDLSEARQFEAYNKLTAFIMHDLKNSVAQLKLIVANAQRHKHNPEFIDDVIDTTANTVERMTRLIEQLREASTTSSKPVELPIVIAAALKRCAARKPTPVVEGEIPNVAILADEERLTTIFEHVIRNAQDATEDGTIRVSFDTSPETVTVAIADDGRGMDSRFVRERLFRPFDSTKGSKGMGIGAYQVREYVRMLGGQVEVQSSPGMGTTFSIRLPVAQQHAVRAVASVR